jgi:hypothetical protein
MGFIKKASYLKTSDSELIHVPESKIWGILKDKSEISSSFNKNNYDYNGFDVKKASKEHPDFVFFKVLAIKANEVNDNGDCFSTEELKKSAHTFVGVPVFTNHQNTDISKAKGKVFHAWFDDKIDGIYTINGVDKVAYPQIARAVSQKYIIGCFPPDAQVLMKDGTEKSIVDIDLGEEVISGEGHVRRVIGKRSRGYDHPILKIKFSGVAQPLELTENHNLYVYRMPENCLCGCGQPLKKYKDKRIRKYTIKFC